VQRSNDFCVKLVYCTKNDRKIQAYTYFLFCECDTNKLSIQFQALIGWSQSKAVRNFEESGDGQFPNKPPTRVRGVDVVDESGARQVHKVTGEWMGRETRVGRMQFSVDKRREINAAVTDNPYISTTRSDRSQEQLCTTRADRDVSGPSHQPYCARGHNA
jgi:hypothetical protein